MCSETLRATSYKKKKVWGRGSSGIGWLPKERTGKQSRESKSGDLRKKKVEITKQKTEGFMIKDVYFTKREALER